MIIVVFTLIVLEHTIIAFSYGRIDIASPHFILPTAILGSDAFIFAISASIARKGKSISRGKDWMKLGFFYLGVAIFLSATFMI